jgi:hypothetical protein
MEKSHAQIKVHSSVGDAAVSGLFSGLQGGTAMAVVIAIFSLLAGQGLGYLGYFSAGTPVQPVVGLVGHLAVSSIYGMLYAFILHWTGLYRLARLPGWLAGLVYALGLWVLAILVILPAAQSLFLTLSWVVFFTGHVAYGLVLGIRMKP